MLYTQSQVRVLLGVSVETFRHWREALPALRRHKGHGPTFTPGDVVALAIVSDLVRLFGVRISVLAPRMEDLFSACHGRSWLALETSTVLVGPKAIRIVSREKKDLADADALSLVIQFSPVVDRLRSKLHATEIDEPQTWLRFRPTVVSRTK